ncbi:TetR family transcriptional regulator [Ilumatobacter fluminis]|uniref:TetR family transcriptional regulator n=1 Tax=Ilumatobacter fluminis TaxID=467091 RepID=A0A4R7I5S2_9ACTN|nr:CerR family C-terminal domain-containing protein [Ilumatobacter fluminis]TDT18156.1 TetR family transcriptional regulator [Ilumatobacter fluminis]
MGDRAADQRRRGEYAKSALTRQAILSAAFPIFGARGLDGASTREIAKAAGVNQPAINYHFGSKELLYRACAELVVEGYREQVGALRADALRGLERRASPEEAADLLSALMDGLADLLISDPTARSWAGFVFREMSEQGEAARFLHEHIWRPGTELVAQLIQVMWRCEPGSPSDEAQLEALLLIADLVAFTNGRPVSMQILGWDDIGPTELAQIKQAMSRRVQDLAARCSDGGCPTASNRSPSRGDSR